MTVKNAALVAVVMTSAATAAAAYSPSCGDVAQLVPSKADYSFIVSENDVITVTPLVNTFTFLTDRGFSGELSFWDSASYIESAGYETDSTDPIDFVVPSGATRFDLWNKHSDVQLSCTPAPVAATQEAALTYAIGRQRQLVTQQPDITGFFLSGTGRGVFNADVTRGAGIFEIANNPNNEVWFRLAGNWSRTDDSDGSYFFGSVGSHAKLNDSVMVGGMLQFDVFEQSGDTAEIEGNGWLAGPYFVAKVPSSEVYVDGRLLFGQSSNEISPDGTYTDTFASDRMLATLKVSGVMEHGTTTLIPSVQASYTADQQDAYTDGLGNEIAAQGVEQGQIALGLGFETPAPFHAGGNIVSLNGGLSGIGSFISQTGDMLASEPASESWRAKIDLGFDVSLRSGGFVAVNTYFDGIGDAGYESYGAEVSYRFEF
jgi:hypothetical protein